MKKILEKKADPILVILILFIVVVGGLFYFQYKSSVKLTDTKYILKITIIEALKHGVDADSLKKEYLKPDSTNK